MKRGEASFLRRISILGPLLFLAEKLPVGDPLFSLFKGSGYFRKAIPQPVEQPFGPGRSAREQIKTYQQKEYPLKHGQE
jgi:hypothetical protein